MGIVTTDDIRKVSEPFDKGLSDGSNKQALVLAIARKLIPLIGMTTKRDGRSLIIVAATFKVLTIERNFNYKKAREYLSSVEGKKWCKSGKQWLTTTALLTDNTVSELGVPEIIKAPAHPMIVTPGSGSHVMPHVHSATEPFTTLPLGLEPRAATAVSLGVIVFSASLFAFSFHAGVIRKALSRLN